MFTKQLIIGAIATTAAFNSYAEDSDLSYTYVGLAYQTGEVLNEDFSGFGVSGSAALNESIFVIGNYNRMTSDDKYNVGFGSDDIEVTQFDLGLGFHTPVAKNIDFVASLSYADAEIKYFGNKADGNGYLLNAGIRAKPTEMLEFGAAINYADIEDDGETGYSLSARYFAAPTLSIGLGYGSADDIDTLSLDVRFDL